VAGTEIIRPGEECPELFTLYGGLDIPLQAAARRPPADLELSAPR
jgi:hypothetical protein